MSENSSNKRLKVIGDKLKDLREKKGYASHDFFAWDNKIAPSQYYRMEKGANITLKTLMRVLDIHGMTLEEFFKGMD